MLNNFGVCLLFLATCLASPIPWPEPSLNDIAALSLARRSVEGGGLACKLTRSLNMPRYDHTDLKSVVSSVSRSDDHVAKRSLSGATIGGANFAGSSTSTTRIASHQLTLMLQILR